jgi:KUP system potassium uptake protein
MVPGGDKPSSAAGVAQSSVPPKIMDKKQDSPPVGEIPVHTKAGFATLMIGSIGVVYGDIGTSPLYALREALHAAGAAHSGVQRADAIGLLSLILWTLMIIVTLKYVVILLRADNDGEGGTLSLMALARRSMGGKSMPVFLLGVAGAAMFFGDALITPAISVLSAVEGLKLVTPALDHYVLPITIVIIFGLFLVQRRGTAAVAAWFGPIMLVWFLVMAIGGLLHVADDPGIVAAINPWHAVRFVATNGAVGLVALGAVFLAVTGAEALYADLGHFGRKPIQVAWIFIAFPSLALNYMGQSALVLANPKALENPFFLLYPEWALLPMVILATMATIIASQAVITGAYSLTRQAIQLRLLPRFDILHTSAEQEGQIYMPQINTLLLIGVLFLCVLFGSSSKLATAYGISVTGTMVVTACLAFIVVWKHWGWPIWAAGLLMLPFFVIDLVFLGANLIKLTEGGYVPLLLAGGVMVSMWTWVKGTHILFTKTRKQDVPMVELARMLAKKPPQRVAGTAVFLTSDPNTTPGALLHSLKHYKVLHEKNVLLTIKGSNAPRVAIADRVSMEQIDDNFSSVTITFGYMEEPNVPKALALCRKQGWKFDIMSTSFFLSRRSIKAAERSSMPAWQDNLFIIMAHNASDASEYFRIPTGRVVEIGSQITI